MLNALNEFILIVVHVRDRFSDQNRIEFVQKMAKECGRQVADTLLSRRGGIEGNVSKSLQL